MSAEEEIKHSTAFVKDKISRMTREQKIDEFKFYSRIAGLVINVDRVMLDQQAVGAPDSALDDALFRLSTIAGSVIGALRPVTREEVEKAMADRIAARRMLRVRGEGLSSHTASPLNLRKSAQLKE
jgi:hypothetical protein